MSVKIEPFHAIAISKVAHELKGQGASIIHMEFGQPSTGAPPAAIARAHAVLDSDPMGYWASEPLKARISQLYRDRYGVEVETDRLTLTAGASPALVLALASAFQPGAAIAFARPGYVAYRNTVKALHLTPIEIGCDAAVRFQLTADALAELDPAPAGVIIASPANPTGTIIPRDELAAIADVCKRRGIRIVSDEIYHGLTYVGPAHSILEFEPDAFVINSFSKYFSMAGWRLGWLVSPAHHAQVATAYMGNLFLMPP
ncbi:MAG TPA: aminotransferase class I/II-fold pyridoxal phosphate-dependent enzyme, partial [Caulobacteraceae bacterium]|nr:aminotransferase class I/II-fold pyridoxal phosphate-dependent enzyme [Caulobacteraceae bacterium]